MDNNIVNNSSEIKQNQIDSSNLTKTKSLRLDSSKQVFRLCFCAMMLAFAVIFDTFTKVVPVLDMPMGGSVNISILFIVLAALISGPVFGYITGFSFAILNFLIDGGAGSFNGWSFFLDYLLSFGLMGTVGFFHVFIRKKNNYWVYYVALFTASLIRYIFTGLSGAIVFAEYAPEGVNPYFYSFVLYNLPYIAVSMVVAMVVVTPLIFAIKSVIKSPKFGHLI